PPGHRPCCSPVSVPRVRCRWHGGCEGPPDRRAVTGRIDQFGNEIIPVYETRSRRPSKSSSRRTSRRCACVASSPTRTTNTGSGSRTWYSGCCPTMVLRFPSPSRPVVRGQSCLNSVIIEAYVADKSREQLVGVEGTAQGQG